jgi:hypothetical protein
MLSREGFIDLDLVVNSSALQFPRKGRDIIQLLSESAVPGRGCILAGRRLPVFLVAIFQAFRVTTVERKRPS